MRIKYFSFRSHMPLFLLFFSSSYLSCLPFFSWKHLWMHECTHLDNRKDFFSLFRMTMMMTMTKKIKCIGRRLQSWTKKSLQVGLYRAAHTSSMCFHVFDFTILFWSSTAVVAASDIHNKYRLFCISSALFEW